MNGKSPMISEAPPFVLRLSKDERRVFQQNRSLDLTDFLYVGHPNNLLADSIADERARVGVRGFRAGVVSRMALGNACDSKGAGVDLDRASTSTHPPPVCQKFPSLQYSSSPTPLPVIHVYATSHTHE